MFPIDPSIFFNKPIIYYGSEDKDEESEEEEVPPLTEAIDLSYPALNGTGTYLYWFDI